MKLTSPRSTQLYQMLASGPISTSPMIRQPGATKVLGSIHGVLPLKGCAHAFHRGSPLDRAGMAFKSNMADSYTI